MATTTNESAATPAAGGHLGRVLPFVAHASVLEAAIAVALVGATYALTGMDAVGAIFVVTACGAFLVYQLDRLPGVAPEDRANRPERIAWVEAHRWYVIGATAAALVAGGLGVLFLRSTTIAAGAALGLLGMIYVLPVLPGRRRLKALWYLKPTAIAGCWAAGVVLLPALQAGRMTTAIALLAAYRFVYILPNVLLADWPDREGDAAFDIDTLANRWPLGRFRAMIGVGTMAAMVVGTWALWSLGVATWMYVDVLGPGATLAYVSTCWWRGSAPRTLWLDTLMLWPALVALGAAFG